MQQQFNLFFLALGFFSRIPMPGWVVYSEQNLNHASRYFTLVGWILGGMVGGVYYLINLIYSPQISLWLAIGFSLLLTGCFHEDGFADMADGFGGGQTKIKKL